MKTNPEQPSQILIREATAKDAGDAVRLICQLGDDSEVTEGYVLHYLSGTDRCILLAERADAVVGLLSYSMRADLFHGGNSVLIEELVVDEGCRGAGIGGALLDELMKRAEAFACKEVCLAVMPDNDEAIRFYKRHGLVEEALFLERHFIL
ncbi:MAG TPA: GNAT family N-acetyltransferase [Anaerolineales bacterium]|nr:GNAT family N-acetyltransferase [Anaerolineales bacterium]